MGGEFYLSTLFMMFFWVQLPDKFRWGACRYVFFFIGATAFHGMAGELNYRISGSNTLVQADVDGDKVADFEISLTGAITLTAGVQYAIRVLNLGSELRLLARKPG